MVLFCFSVPFQNFWKILGVYCVHCARFLILGDFLLLESRGKEFEGKCYLSARRIVPTLVSWLLREMTTALMTSRYLPTSGVFCEVNFVYDLLK